MQELANANVDKKEINPYELSSDKFANVNSLLDGETISIEKLKAIGKEARMHYNLESKYDKDGKIKCVLKADYQFAHRIGCANRDKVTFYYKSEKMLDAWEFEKPSRTYDEILAEFNKGKNNTTS